MLELLLIVFGNVTLSASTTVNGITCAVSYTTKIDTLTYISERIYCPPMPYYVLNVSTATFTLFPGYATTGTVSGEGLTVFTAQWKLPWPTLITFYIARIRGKLEGMLGRVREAGLKHSEEVEEKGTRDQGKHASPYRRLGQGGRLRGDGP